jgi:hypothetical protein
MVDEVLHQKERRARVDGKEPVPQGKIRVDQRAAIRCGGRIDKRVDAAEPLRRKVEDRVWRVRLFEIRLDKCARAPALSTAVMADGALRESRPTITTDSAPLRAAPAAIARPMP